MFCRKCGKTLIDGDRFCPYCGAQVIERKDEVRQEEVVYNETAKDRHFFSESVKPSWNLESFPDTEAEPKKTDDILVDWKQHILIEPTFKPDKKMSFSEQLQAFESSFDITVPPIEEGQAEEKAISEIASESAGKTAEDNHISIAKSTLIFERPKSNIELQMQAEDEAEAEANFVSEDEFLEACPEKERFYTFSQKNAEFQKLLDKEYEKIKASKEGTYHEIQELSKTRDIEADEKIEDRNEADKRFFEELKKETENIAPKEPKEEQVLQEPKEETVIDAPDSKTQIPDMAAIKAYSEAEKEAEKLEEEGKAELRESGIDWKNQDAPFEDERTDSPLTVIVAVLAVVVLLLGIALASLALEQFAPDTFAGKTVHVYLEKARDIFRSDSA